MPRPKASTQIESVAQEVFLAAGKVILIGSPELYGNIGFPAVSDRVEGCGLPGLYAGSKLFKMHDFRLHDPGHSLLTHEQGAQ